MAAARPQRNTLQRRVILEELCRLTSHPTAVELYQIVRQRLPHVSLGTVYRNLDLLAQSGTINKLDFSDAETRFDGDARPHDHLRCVRCGRVDDLPGAPLVLSTEEPHDLRGYQVLGHRLELMGVCPRCREQTPTPESPKETEAC
jgi:Fur family transcriptional regulator, ferric uptake regulator